MNLIDAECNEQCEYYVPSGMRYAIDYGSSACPTVISRSSWYQDEHCAYYCKAIKKGDRCLNNEID